MRVSKRCVELTGIFTGKSHLDSHFINKPPNQRGARLSAHSLQCLCPLHLLIPGSAWSDDSHRHLLCLPRCSRGDGMVPWIPSALGHPTQQVWGARNLNSGRGMRICTSLLSNVGFSVGSRESEGPFLGIARYFTSILCVYPLDASSKPPYFNHGKISPGIAKCPLGDKSIPI